MSPMLRRIAVLVAIMVPLVLALSLFLDWWVLVLIPPLLLIGVLALMLSSTKAAVPGETEAPPDPFVESGPQGARIREDLLPSQDDEYPFVFSAMVRWRWTGAPDPRLRNPGEFAKQMVMEQSGEVSTGYRPKDHDVARHRVASVLGVAAHGFDGALEVWAEDVTLTLSEEDENRLARIAKARKEGALWEVERSVESAKRRYFADDVLATPGSAIVWDLVRGDADVNRTHGLIEVLTRVAEASKGEDPEDLLERLRAASPEAFSFLNEIVREERTSEAFGGAEKWSGRDGSEAVVGESEDELTRSVERIAARIGEEIKDEDKRVQLVHRLVELFEKASLTELAELLRRAHPLPDEEDGFVLGVTYEAPEPLPTPSPNGNGVPH
ncbi:hypothetical protein [Nocardiopsis ganjiahuensis]|uniref:hypothetical protein n=1 Tax=Nocardiopsis ganjiahuensis TaxID=239984 RepID=UPI00034B7480|nr:hypothetical protein [Nocardiopsis ganjiahuensis]